MGRVSALVSFEHCGIRPSRKRSPSEVHDHPTLLWILHH